MKRFCVECGKETIGLVDGLCVDCYTKLRHVLDLPRSIDVDFDKRSSRVRVDGKWVGQSETAFVKLVESIVAKAAKARGVTPDNLFVELFPKGEVTVAKVSFNAHLGKVDIFSEAQITIRPRYTISDASMKLASNYHEAIIQLRFIENIPREAQKPGLNEVLRLLKRGKEKNELSEAVAVKPERKGYDLYVGSKKAAKKVAASLARIHETKVIHSSKLIGVDQSGKTKYRDFFCVKI
ncbi:MAG: NMD3-related protein [archaeon]